MIRAYALTDPQYYGSDPKILAQNVRVLLERKPCDYLCLRDKSNTNYALLAEAFMATCKEKNFSNMLLHTDVALAVKLGAFGVHLTSTQQHHIADAKAAGLFCVISTHTEAQILKATALGADAVTYSPIFATPGKGTPKGLEDLKEKTARIQTKIIALGGIVTNEQIAAVAAAGAFAFASIRYFVDASSFS